eukprot:4428849-Pyramimonas_sp.AAC.2
MSGVGGGDGVCVAGRLEVGVCEQANAKLPEDKAREQAPVQAPARDVVVVLKPGVKKPKSSSTFDGTTNISKPSYVFMHEDEFIRTYDEAIEHFAAQMGLPKSTWPTSAWIVSQTGWVSQTPTGTVALVSGVEPASMVLGVSQRPQSE